MFANERYARAVYQEVVKRTLNAGVSDFKYSPGSTRFPVASSEFAELRCDR